MTTNSRLNFHCDNRNILLYTNEHGTNYITVINMDVLFIPQMASNICQRLINKVWKSYATDLDKAPHAEGIYTIGFNQSEDVRYIYVGHSKDVHRRLQEHKSQTLAIDEFVKKQFSSCNDGKNLRIKWVEETNGKCVEGEYLECMEKKLGYWPNYNKKRGNKCN